jgi:hypothetical protein
MPWKFADVDAFARTLDGVTVGKRWSNKTWFVRDNAFIWERPLGKSDLEKLGDATPPTGDIFGVRVESLDAKDALLSMDMPGFFTIEHFKNYPALLIELRKARVADVRAAIREAHRVMAEKKPAKRRKRSSR